MYGSDMCCKDNPSPGGIVGKRGEALLKIPPPEMAPQITASSAFSAEAVVT
jgi:hypothetical protein